jgi:GntR family transcriptional regulator/MocR family aminotransferase
MIVILRLERGSGTTLQRQVYVQIRDQILGGQLAQGAEIPASRVLAREYGISRNTVIQAYEWLLSEGYLETHPGARTLVSRNLPERSLNVGPIGNDLSRSAARVAPKTPIIFKSRPPKLPRYGASEAEIDFWPGRPNHRQFPLWALKQSIVECLVTPASALSDYGDPGGLLALREGIAGYLRAARGIRVDPDQIVVTSGVQEALNIVARMFIAPGAEVVVENPCYGSAALVFESYGARMVPVDVDEHGMDVSRLPGAKTALAYVTPSHQFPTGATLPLERRLKLIEWAHNTGAYLIEDDYDSDYRYAGPPLVALAGLDTSGSVIYVGTFSKSIGAGLRTGYMVVPRHLVETARDIKTLTSYGHPWIEQVALADFLRGGFQRHLRRIRRSYAEVRDVLISELVRAFGPQEIWGTENGMHIMWRLPAGLPPPNAFVERIRSYGVGVHTLASGGARDFGSRYADSTLLLGYSSLTKQQIISGVRAMARAAEDLASKGVAAIEDRPLGVPARLPRSAHDLAKAAVQR